MVPCEAVARRAAESAQKAELDLLDKVVVVLALVLGVGDVRQTRIAPQLLIRVLAEGLRPCEGQCCRILCRSRRRLIRPPASPRGLCVGVCATTRRTMNRRSVTRGADRPS